MPQILKAANGNAVVANGGWTNPANAQDYQPDLVYATAEPAVSTSITSDFTFPALTDAEIPPGSTINSVKLEADMNVSATQPALSMVGLQGYKSGVADSGAEDANHGSARYVFTFATVPSVTDLKTAGRMAARIRATKDTAAGTLAAQLDFVVLRIDYTPPANGVWSAIAANGIGPSGTPGTTGRSVSVGTIAIGDCMVAVINRGASSNDLASDTVTDSLGNTWTRVGSTYSSLDGQGGSLWRCIATVAGACTVTSAYAAGQTQTYEGLAVVVFRSTGATPTVISSAHTATATPSTSSGAGADTATAGSPSVQTGDLVVGGFENMGAKAVLAGTNFLTDWMTDGKKGEPGGEFGLEHLIAASAGTPSVTSSLQVTSQRYGAGYVVFRSAATGSSQFARPSADAAVGGWTPTPTSPTTLFDKLDETTTDDTDYISATAT